MGRIESEINQGVADHKVSKLNKYTKHSSLAALTIVPEGERETVVGEVEKSIVSEYG